MTPIKKLEEIDKIAGKNSGIPRFMDVPDYVEGKPISAYYGPGENEPSKPADNDQYSPKEERK